MNQPWVFCSEVRKTKNPSLIPETDKANSARIYQVDSEKNVTAFFVFNKLTQNSSFLSKEKLSVKNENFFVIISSENNSNKLSQVISVFSLNSKFDLCSWDFLFCMPLQNSKVYILQSLYEEVKLQYKVWKRVDLLCRAQCLNTFAKSSIRSRLPSFILLFPTLFIATDFF